MSLRRLNFMNWPIRTKLAAIFTLVVVLPALLVLIPYSAYRRSVDERDQSRARLEVLGPFEIAQAEQTLNGLTVELERLVTDPAYYSQLEAYLAAPPQSRDQSASIEAIVEQVLRSAPSLTRVRLLDSQGRTLLDVSQHMGIITSNHDLSSVDRTPADALIAAGGIGAQTTLSEIYLDARQSPSIDIIYAPQAALATPEDAPVAGWMVFSQNLAIAEEDRTLPSLYAALSSFPTGEQATHAFLLNEEGQLISPAQKLDMLQDAHSSDGFRAAQREESGISTYNSPLLETRVIGYHARVIVPNGPSLVVLVETPLEAINRQAWQEGLLPLFLIGLGALLLGSAAALFGTLVIARPLSRLTHAVRQMSAGHLDVPFPGPGRRDEIGMLSSMLAGMAVRLNGAIHDLERHVEERNRKLDTTLEIGRILTSLRDLDSLLEEVVRLIRDQFEETVYHVQVFLVDPHTNRAILRASTGTVGRQLLQRGHFLEVGSRSVIGSVTAMGHAVVTLDTSNNPIHQRNEFLPDTRAEMALPLRLGNRVIGALDLQSTRPDAFTEQDVDLFQGIADQITIAIENALLFEESRVRLQEIERLNRTLTEAAWLETERQREPPRLDAASGPVSPGNAAWSELQLEAMQTRQIAARTIGETVTFAVPVLLRDQVLGAVEWQVPRLRYTEGTRQTALALTMRLALAAENIRLFEQSRRAAQRELLVNRISSKLIGTTNIDEILQTAVRELGLALHTPQMAIRLTAPTGSPAGTPGDADDR
ncbi:MAG TPA: GAF domain-containing protein [Aggregatilineales bacterium]|nr:GAF domain-containing protein [Aggregatilineales bacterium]